LLSTEFYKKEIGSSLKQLKFFRKKADYDDEFTPNNNQTALHCALAETVYKQIKKLK
jgi:hypothetical protein